MIFIVSEKFRGRNVYFGQDNKKFVPQFQDNVEMKTETKILLKRRTFSLTAIKSSQYFTNLSYHESGSINCCLTALKLNVFCSSTELFRRRKYFGQRHEFFFGTIIKTIIILPRFRIKIKDGKISFNVLERNKRRQDVVSRFLGQCSALVMISSQCSTQD